MSTPIRNLPPAATPAKTGQQPGAPAQKDFKEVAAKVQSSGQSGVPMAAVSLAPEQKAQASRVAAERLKLPASERTSVTHRDLSQMNKQLEGLRDSTSKLAIPQKEQLLSRLSELDNQFRRTGQLSEQALKTNDPRQFLALQIEMSTLSKNIELITKVVDQFTSGTKQILQTQV
jgi:hypothetical protein